MRAFRPHFRIRGNFRARGSNNRGGGGGIGRDNALPITRVDTLRAEMEHGSGLNPRSRTPPFYDAPAPHRYASSSYDRRDSGGHYQEKRYGDRPERERERDDFGFGRRRSRSRSRSPYQDYYRKRQEAHSSSTRFRSRSRSSERSGSRSPRRYREPSPSPSRGRSDRRSPEFERDAGDKYQRRTAQIEREPFAKHYQNPSPEKNLLQDDRKRFQSPPLDKSPLIDAKHVDMKTNDLFSDFERSRKDRNLRDKYHDSSLVSSLFREDDQPKLPRNNNQLLPWNSSPPPRPVDPIEPKPAIKSILKKSNASYDEDPPANQRFSLQSSSSSSSMFIPGLGDIEAIEDEEKFLYGVGVGETRKFRAPEAEFPPKKDKTDDIFHPYRNLSPKRAPNEYARDRRYSPFDEEAPPTRADDFTSLLKEASGKMKGNKDFDDIFKSIGMEMFRQLQKKSEERVATPPVEQPALFDESRANAMHSAESLWTKKPKAAEVVAYPQNDVYAAGDASVANMGYYQYPAEQYSTGAGAGGYGQAARSNLRVVPIQQQVGGPVATNLKVVPTVEYCADAGTEARRDEERQSLLRQRENQYKRLDIMQQEIERLRKQQGEMMRKKQKTKDGHKDPLLVENSKLQEEISRQISAIKRSIEGLSDKLRVGAGEGKGGEKMAEIRQVEEQKPEYVEAVKIEKRDDETDLEYDYFDPGGHWCKQCNQMLPHLHNFLQHLQEKKHIQGMDPYDRPWLPEALKNPPITKPKKGLIAAIKGVQFLKPVAAYYCSICSEFMGDASCAELHVKSKNHNYKYLQYVLENPYYERCWNLDKAAGISVKTEEMKRKWIEDEKAQKAKRKRLEMEAEQKNRELVKAEAARDKKVHELEESHNSREPDKPAKNKEIKLTLKVEKRDKSQDRNRRRDDYRKKSDAVFGKFAWKHKEKEAERDSVREAEKEAARLAQAEKAKIAIRLSGKTVIPPSIPWQTIRRPVLKPKKPAPVPFCPIAPTPVVRPKYEPRVEPKKATPVVDIFMTSEPPPPGTDDTVLPAPVAVEAPPVFTVTDIADAFTGKYNDKKGSKNVVFGPPLPPETEKMEDKTEVIVLDDDENVNSKKDDEMSLRIESVVSLTESPDASCTGEPAKEKVGEVGSEVVEKVEEINPEVVEKVDEVGVEVVEKIDEDVGMKNIFDVVEKSINGDDEMADDCGAGQVDAAEKEEVVEKEEKEEKLHENCSSAEGLNKDGEDGAFEVHIENMLVLDEALFDTE